MSPHDRPQGPRLGLQAKPAHEAALGPQGPSAVRIRPLGGKARSAKGAA
jgi:hypothetical protein